MEKFITLDHLKKTAQSLILDTDSKINGLPTVAHTGDYNDLINKPEIQNIEQSDWNQNDSTADDYIKNRTHYGYIDDNFVWCENKEIIFTNAMPSNSFYPFPSTSEQYEGIHKSGGFIENETYTVTLNNTEYNLICYTGETTSSERTVFCLGNSSLSPASITIAESYNIDLPFLIQITPESNSTSITFRRDKNVILNNETQILSIQGPARVYSNLSYKYLNGKLIEYGTSLGAETFNSSSVNNNIASSVYSHAEGFNTTASGSHTHSEGYTTIASGNYSHAEGYKTKTNGGSSHSEGYFTITSGTGAHTEGGWTDATGNYSHAEGVATGATAEGSHSEGTVFILNDVSFTKEANSLVCEITNPSQQVDYANQVTPQNVIIYYYSQYYKVSNISIIDNKLAGFTFEESFDKISETISGTAKILISTLASGIGSHAEGGVTWAAANYSHAEGWDTGARGNSSHSEGYGNYANGTASHVEGRGTRASSNYQHVQGKYNIEDSSNIYADIVGNGTADDARSNAYTLDWSGNGVYAGKVTVGAAPTANMDVATKQYVDSAIGNINSFDVEVVASTSAVTTPNNHTIYFIPQAVNSSVHDEYMYINNNWELIGTTSVDLSGYLQSSDIADWAKASTKPSYTASEVGAVPSIVETGHSGSMGQILNTAGNITISEQVVSGSSSLTMSGPNVTLTSTKDLSNSSIILKTNSVNNITLSEGQTTITGIVTPTSDTMAANKKYVDDAVSGITIPTVPTNVSSFTNDAGYLTSFTETDPTVPAWAKAANKPTYTAAEVGALPDTTVIPAAQVQSDWNATTGMGVILNKPTIPTVPTTISSFTNDSGYLTLADLPIYDGTIQNG